MCQKDLNDISPIIDVLGSLQSLVYLNVEFQYLRIDDKQHKRFYERVSQMKGLKKLLV